MAPACAGIPSQYYATPVDAEGRAISVLKTKSGLIVSGQELADYSSRNFGLVELTFENATSEWIRIRSLELDFGDEARNRDTFLPEGSDLDSWYLATTQRNDVRGTNSATALGALLALGEVVAVVGAVSGDRKVAAAGAAVALGSATGLSVTALHDRDERAERVRMLPRSHLLALPFSVPPHLFAKKWLLLNTRDDSTPCVNSLLIDYDLETREHERVSLTFRQPLDASEWQRDACAPPFNGFRRPR